MKIAIACIVVLTAWIAAAQDEPRPEEPEEVESTIPFSEHTFPKLVEKAKGEGRAWLSFIDNDSLECGVYRLAAGARDGQSPHATDEVYYVVSGRGKFTAGEESCDVLPGGVLFVAAGVEHRFHDITEDLELLVFFSKVVPEGKDG